MENSHATNGSALQERLNQPQTVAALTRLLDRIDTLEQTVDRLAVLLEQGPGMVAMVGDMVDETVRNAAASGVQVEDRLKTALTLAEKLTAPDMIAKLDQLLSMVDQAPGMVAMVGDMVDDTVRNVSASGVDIEARLQTALTLAEKLTAPDMVAKLDQLLSMVDQAPGMVAMAGDMVDDAVRNASASGVDVESRLQTALTLAEKLTAPDMVDKLDQLLLMAEQAPGMAAMVGDMVDDTMRSLTASGINIEERMQTGLAIAEKLTTPEMVTNLDQLLTLADQAPKMAAMMGDIFDETYRTASASGVNLESMVQQGAKAAVKFSQLVESEEYDALMESGMLDPAAVGILGQAGRALTISRQAPIEKVGLFGMLRALSDPNVQQAIGFLMAFGKEFGKTL